MRGKFPKAWPIVGGPDGGFNEARALCAGSSLPLDPLDVVAHASMRPAHCAREVKRSALSPSKYPDRFNEARALCAGSWTRLLEQTSIHQTLQ